MQIDELETPVVAIDLDVMEATIRRRLEANSLGQRLPQLCETSVYENAVAWPTHRPAARPPSGSEGLVITCGHALVDARGG